MYTHFPDKTPKFNDARTTFTQYMKIFYLLKNKSLDT